LFRNHAQSIQPTVLIDFPRKIAFQRVADDGIRTHTSLSRERILSPLRLPFRHIGAARFTMEKPFYFL
jgi:hypothetical protein